MPVTCEHCNAPYAPMAISQRYCSAACRDAAQYARRAAKLGVVSLDAPRTCPHCNGEFVRHHAQQIYCSHLCGDRATETRRNGSRDLLSRECPRCRSTFETRSTRQVYCSSTCEPVAARPGQNQCRMCRSFFDGRVARASLCSVRCRKAAASAKRQMACEPVPELDADGEFAVKDLEASPRRLAFATRLDPATFYKGPLRPTWLSPPRAGR